MQAKKHLATITILLKDRQSHSPDVNKVLTDFGHHIIARLGVNVSRTCIDHCTAMITIAVEANREEIDEITDTLDAFYGVVAKSCVMTE